MSTDDEGTSPVDASVAEPTPADDPPAEIVDEQQPRSRRRTIIRRVLISVGVLGLVLALIIGGGLWFLTNRYGGNIARVSDVFGTLDQKARPAESSPVKGDGTPVTFLL